MPVINALVGLLPEKAQPYAKALVPAAVTLVGVGSQYVATGQLDTATIGVAVGGVVATVLTWLVPNKPR